MMKRETITIADIYVPTKRRGTLEQKRVDEIAASILDKGLQAPILVRADGARLVLVEGLHRLEAAKALGEKTIIAFLVDANSFLLVVLLSCSAVCRSRCLHFSATRQRVRQQSMAVANPKSLNAIGWHFFQLVA